MRLTAEDSEYPQRLLLAPFSNPPEITALGNLELLGQKSLALFCSVKCPGSLILKAHDLAQELKDSSVPVISGFHSPIEQECLTVLLRGSVPLILCPARSIPKKHYLTEFKEPLASGRMLILSPFSDSAKRATTATASERNRFVASLARWTFVIYASPGGGIEALGHALLGAGLPIFSFQSTYTENLIDAGALPITTASDLRGRLVDSSSHL